MFFQTDATENNKVENGETKPTSHFQLEMTPSATMTNRRLSFSDDASPPKTPANTAINM